MQSELKDITIGSTFEQRFIIEALLGHGGMGTVFRAKHTQLGKFVALKVMHGSFFTNERLRKAFLREIQAAGALHHENIVGILASGLTADGLAWVAMDLLEGVPLHTVLTAGKMEQSRALSILRQVAAGLAYAHSHNIIHRDIKPSNVMLVKDGENEKAIIVDFGLAKNLAQAQTQTATTLQGSPPYMSPEQCQAQQTDARSDVYSFGCMMFEMLTGQAPFEGESPYAVMFSHIHDEPPEVNPVVTKCLKKDPGERYADGNELVAALSGSGNGASACTTVTAAKRKARVKPILAAALVAVMAAISYAVATNRFNEGMLEQQAKATAASIGGIPLAADKARCDKLSLKQQKQIVKYWKLRVDAVIAKIKASPDVGRSEALDLTKEMKIALDTDKNGNEWYKAPVYDEALLEAYRLIKGIPDLKTDPGKSAAEPIIRLAVTSSVRAIFGSYRPLVLPSFDLLKLAKRIRPVASDARETDEWLFRHYIRFAVEADDPVQRKWFVQRAEQVQNDVMKEWRTTTSHPSHLLTRDIHFAVIAYLQGRLELAKKILSDDIDSFLASKEPDLVEDDVLVNQIQKDFEQVRNRPFADAILKEKHLL